MEFTREIYWNVGHGFLTLGPMYLLALTAIVSLFTITDGHFFKLFDVFRESQFSKSGFA